MIHISLLYNSLYKCLVVLVPFFFFKDIAFAVYIIKYKFLKVFTTLDQDANGGYSKNLQGLQDSDGAQSLAQTAGR